MPIYEYQCTVCGHQLEAIQKMSEPPLTDCPNCHKTALTKLVSAAGFQLKGTGWYATDFRDKGKKTEGKTKESSSESSSSSSSDTKSNDTKLTGGSETKS